MGEANLGPLSGRIRVGTSGWSYPAWVGPFYPPRTPASRMLAVYAESFTTVEAHSTHRRRPTAAALQGWVKQVPEDFRFAPKAHTGITHRRDTDGLIERVVEFFAALQPLAERLGPVLFVLPHRQPDLPRLDLLLEGLAAAGTPEAAFELGPAWHVPEVVDRLAAVGASLTAVDRDDGPSGQTPGARYFRLRRAAYDDAGLDEWAGRLRQAAAGGGDVYAFVKHDEGGDGPRYAGELVKRL